MSRRTALGALLAAVACCASVELARPLAARAAAIAQDPADDVQIRVLLDRVERAVQAADSDAFFDLLSVTADRKGAAEFAAGEFRAGTTRCVIQERDRQHLQGTLPGNGYSLTVDAFLEYGDRARVATWQIDVKRVDEDAWLVSGQDRISSVENLYRLVLNPTAQFDARNFTVRAEDIELTLVEGSVFTVDTDQGVTGLVLLGRGEMRFRPAPQTEVEQVRIYAGADALESRFDAAFVRMGTLGPHADRSVLTPRAVDPKAWKRAERVFRDESVKTYAVDLGDLSRSAWSLLPGSEDFVAEVRTRRFGTLTYARSSSEAEDISFFERRRHRNIAVYASKDKLAANGPFFDESAASAYDVLDYDIEVAVAPERRWIDGRASMRIRTRAPSINQLTIRLADSLVVRSVSANRLGRLFSLRATGQDVILVNLPVTVLKGTDLTLKIEYGGRLDPQPPERESVAPGQGDSAGEDPSLIPEPSFLYSNRSYWYPQSPISDYATATIQITVPAMYACVASGSPAAGSPETVTGPDAGQTRKVYAFNTTRPLRYLAFLVSRLTRADRWNVVFDKPDTVDAGQMTALEAGGGTNDTLDLIVDANPSQVWRGFSMAERAVDVVQFYQSIVGDSPYATFMLALIESKLPGGHSPGYFASLNQPLPNTGISWRNDPATFANYPEFFLAHEVAHQWWGQAVGWRNYHEQWLSEGFAQYFAALYAQRFRGDKVYAGVMRQMRKWAIDESDQGPVYLGYRVGHIRDDGRAFRAVVYNKGAIVLHMLRRLVGDDVFYKGLRRFYVESRYTKVGTNDFQRAMETESGRSLDRFFERWIYHSSLPRVTFRFRVEPADAGQDVVLHFEQAGDIFDLPVTVVLEYANGTSVDVVVPVTEQTVDHRVHLDGPLKTARISRDDGTLADVTQN